MGWFLRESRPGVTTGTSAFGAAIEYPNDRWSGGVNAREVQANFNPAVGFVARRNYRRYNQFVGFGPRPNNQLVRQVRFNTNLTVFTDLRNRLVERNLHLNLANVQFQSQDQLSIEVDRNYIRLEAPFPISPGITLPMGSQYSFTRMAITGQTANLRRLALSARFETGGFYSGDRRQSVLGLTLRARPGYIFSVNGEWNEVDLAEGRFSTNLVRVVTDSQFSPFMALVNNFQFDTASRVLGWQSRYRWIVKPGNDLYIVYTQNWVEDPLVDRFSTLDQRFATKALYTYRF